VRATTLRRRRQRPREATPAAGARCDLATRGEHDDGRERRPEVPACQVRAPAGTTEVVGWRARGAPGLLTLGTVALADAGIGVAVCFVYYQVARRSMLALAAWPICVGALVLAAAFHGSIEVLALEMVAAAIRRGSRHSVYRQARLFYQRQGRGRFDLVVDEVNARPFEAARWAAGTPVVAPMYQPAREVWFHELAWPVAALVGDFFLEPRWGWTADRSTLANTLWLNSAWNWHGPALYTFAADFHHFRMVLWRYAVPVVAFAALGVAGLRARTRHHQQRLRRDGGSAGRPARPRCRRAVAGVEPDRCSERAGEVAGAVGAGSGPGGAGVSAGDRAAPAGFDAVRVPVAVSCETRLGASRCVAAGRRQTGIGSNHGGRRRAGRPVLPPEEWSPR